MSGEVILSDGSHLLLDRPTLLRLSSGLCRALWVSWRCRLDGGLASSLTTWMRLS